jgi:hypothetical protein
MGGGHAKAAEKRGGGEFRIADCGLRNCLGREVDSRNPKFLVGEPEDSPEVASRAGCYKEVPDEMGVPYAVGTVE